MVSTSRSKGAVTMATYQQTAPAPTRSTGGTDVAAWALVALIVVLVCATAGWAIARQTTPGAEDLAQSANLAAGVGLSRGESIGYGEGARLGRREAALKARTAIQTERRTAAREGYAAGFAQGRMKAGDPDAYLSAGASSASGAYPAAGYEDVLASSLMGSDASGYASSAYDSLGYGDGATTPYLGSSTAASTSPGDEQY